MRDNNQIDTLLDLDGIIIEQVGGYWTKFEVRKIEEVTEGIPHGIRYSLTLHNKHGERIVGFDNAHAIRISKKELSTAYDHFHRYSNNNAVPYKFIDPYQLIKDFWLEVDKTLEILGVKK